MTTVSPAAPAHIPDVLETLAQLPNDDVFTRPKLANAMLDVLPAEVWSDPKLKWVDPATKSGVFLREAAKRLMVGLESWEPDGHRRREHILKDMLFGTSTTLINGEISRRSLYQSKDASGTDVKDDGLRSIIVEMNSRDGNVPYVATEHTIDPKTHACTICRAPEALIRENREHFAYSFIHRTYPTKELFDMKFDVIVGNPPYQIGVDGSNRDRPIYQYFVDRAIALDPRYILMITPSRWFAGGLGLNEYREQRLNDRRMRALVDYPKVYDAFPNVKIRGGVSYFLWDREHDGPCQVQTMWDGHPLGGPVERYLNEWDVVVRRNEAVSIVRKVKAKGEATMDQTVSSRLPFGLQTTAHGAPSSEGLTDPIEFYGSKRRTWMERSAIEVNRSTIDHYKVLLHRAYGEEGDPPFRVTASPTLIGPRTACSGTYLVIGGFAGQQQARRLDHLLRTRFIRFLVQLRMNTQDIKRGTFAFVPELPLDRDWDDAALYARYELTSEEITFIESQVRKMSDGEVAAPTVDADDDEAEQE